MTSFDPFAVETVKDPYPLYERLRREPGLHWSEPWKAFVVSRYEDVKAVLRDDRFSARHTPEQLGALPSMDLGTFGRVATLPNTDPPRHTRLRKLVSKAFTPGEVRRIDDQVTDILDAALDKAADTGHLEFVKDLAGPLPTLVIARLLGVSEGDAQLFKKWSDDLVVAFEGSRATPERVAAAEQAAASLDSYLRTEIANRPDDEHDLLVRLREASLDGDQLTEDEVVATAILLLVAGNETTTSLMANGLTTLLQNPDELAKLHAEPDLVPTAIEEMLRYTGPVHILLRTAREDIEVAGGVIPARQSAALLLGSANRDEDQFDNADQLRIDRTPNDHVAFGRNRHFCLGAPLARREATLAFTALLERVSHIELDGPEPSWEGSLQTRRVNEVPVAVTFAGSN